jgi:hypothetical protein
MRHPWDKAVASSLVTAVVVIGMGVTALLRGTAGGTPASPPPQAQGSLPPSRVHPAGPSASANPTGQPALDRHYTSSSPSPERPKPSPSSIPHPSVQASPSPSAAVTPSASPSPSCLVAVSIVRVGVCAGGINAG